MTVEALITYSKVFVPHGMQSDGGFPHLSLQFLEGYVQFKLNPVANTQLLAQPPQHEHPVFVLLVPAPTNQDQLQSLPAPKPLPPPVQHLLESFDLQPVVLLRPELPDGDDRVALPVPVLLQRHVQERADVAGWVDHAGAVGSAPQ